ncbi:MAG: hypothetical protein ACLFRL_09255, partial [Desulfohalobiaceae bacterium]
TQTTTATRIALPLFLHYHLLCPPLAVVVVVVIVIDILTNTEGDRRSPLQTSGQHAVIFFMGLSKSFLNIMLSAYPAAVGRAENISFAQPDKFPGLSLLGSS